MAINYDAGTSEANYTPSQSYNMVGKVAKQVIKGVTGDNRLAELHRGKIENGESVEDTVLGLLDASPLVDKVPGTPFSAPEFVPAVQYYNEWNTEQYATGLTLRNLRKYLTAGKSAEEIGGMVAGQLAQSDTQHDYETIRNMLLDNTILTTSMCEQTIGSADRSETATNEEVLKRMKDVVDGMKFANTEFNKAGIKRRTLPDDIVVLMDYHTKNKLDVEALAGVFNLSKAELNEKIIVVDGLDNVTNPTDTNAGYSRIVIADKNAFQIWDRLYEQTEAWDAQQLRENYFLTVDRLYGMSPLYDAVFIDCYM